MNLNDLYENREPYQQAIDRLEQRRIEDLEAKMDDLIARAKASTDPKVKEALRQEFAKAKAERDSYYKVNIEEAPGAETLAHNQATDASNLKALGMAEDYTSDTNYTYTVFIDGNKEGTYGSKEEAKAVVKRKKEQAPGRDYRIKPKARTSASSIKKFYSNRDRNLDESTDHLKVSPHDEGAFAALKGKPYSSNPYPKGSNEHLKWSIGHNSMRAQKASLDEHGGGGAGPAQWHAYVKAHRTNEDEIDEHGGGVNGMKNYISWRKKANTERGITKAPPPVGKPALSKLPSIPKGSVHSKLDQSRGVVPKAAFGEDEMDEWKNSAPGETEQDDLIKVEGWQDFNKVEPYEVCLAGKPVKQFDYYEDARRFHDNWKKKLYAQGEKEKADKITLNPIMKEAANPAQQAAIAINMKKHHQKPKTDEARDGDVNFGSTVSQGSWVAYDPETKQIKKRFKTRTAGKSYAETHKLGFASSEFYNDRIKDQVAEEGWAINPEHLKGPRSMKAAANKPTGPKFSGYLKGTDPAPNEYTNKGVGGCEESENPMGEKELAYLIAKAKGMKSKPDPELHKGDEHEINGDRDRVGEGIAGNMTARSNPLTQPLRARNFVAKNAIQSGAGKHANQLKKAAAAGRHAKHKGQLELDEMTDDEVAKIRKDAEEYTTKQMNKPKQAEPKKSFMQQVGDKQIGMVKGAWKGLTGKLEESDNFLTWAVRNGYNITKPAVYESAKKAYNALLEDCGPIAQHETYYGEMIEAKGLGKRVKIVKGPEAGQTGTIGEVRPGAFKGAPGYYTVDLDNGSHIQVRKEALRLIKDEELAESLKKGEYFIWTVYFDDGTSKRIKVTSDEFDPYEYYANQNKVVVNVDYDWSIHS